MTEDPQSMDPDKQAGAGEAHASDPERAKSAGHPAVQSSTSADLARLVTQSKRFMEAFGPMTRVTADLQDRIASNHRLMQSIYESTRWVDHIMPQLAKPLELAATAELARAVSGSSALFTARVALAANFRLAETLNRIRMPQAQLDAFTEASRAIASILESHLSVVRFYPQVEKAIAQVTVGWRMAAVIPPIPPPVALDRVMAAGATTLEIATAGSVIVGSPRPGHEVPRWEDAPFELRDRMRSRLAEIDPGLVLKLDGVWERVSKPGPDAASQAANSLIEVIDWLLRLAAPDGDVLTWHEESRGPAALMTDKGQPTRALRVNYVLASANRDAKPARRFIAGLLDILDFLQGAKHGLEFDDVEAVTRLVPAVEALLTYILI